MKFNGICLITSDVPALTEFYKKVLGVEAQGDSIHAEVCTHGTALSIFSLKGMEDMAPGSMQGSGHGSVTLVFEVQDVDAEYEHLKALGVEFVLLPKNHPWGYRSLWFRDPDGNIVDFYARLNEQGGI